MPNVSTTVVSNHEAAESNNLRKSKGWKGLYPKVTVRLNGELGDVMNELQDATRASSPSDVVKRALIVYHTLVMQKLAGNEPYIDKKDSGISKKIPIFL